MNKKKVLEKILELCPEGIHLSYGNFSEEDTFSPSSIKAIVNNGIYYVVGMLN